MGLFDFKDAREAKKLVIPPFVPKKYLDSSKSHVEKITPLKLNDVTKKCIAILDTMPFERNKEGISHPTFVSPDSITPQKGDGGFCNIYIKPEIIINNALQITADSFFPNYHGYIYEIDLNNKKQLLLVGFSDDLELTTNELPLSLPFLIYIPPSPQDNAENHKKKHMKLYAKTPLDKIPYIYKDKSTYPYSWDWLYYQFLLNMYKLSFQLKKSKKPYVFVVPLIKDINTGMELLNDGNILEQCLLGIQKIYFDKTLKNWNYLLPDIQHVTFCAFSVGNSILNSFIDANRGKKFYQKKIKDFFILDPTFGTITNHSKIITTIISTMLNDKTKSIFLYAQDTYYINSLIEKIKNENKITHDLKKDKIFSNPNVKNIFFANLEAKLFTADIKKRTNADGFHNAFPILFVNDAASRSNLSFSPVNNKKQPKY